MLHAVFRVGNLDDTIEYYKKNFGMKQIRYRDIPEVGEYSNWPQALPCHLSCMHGCSPATSNLDSEVPAHQPAGNPHHQGTWVC